MIRSLLTKVGLTTIASVALAASCLTAPAHADVVISKSGIGGRAQFVNPMNAICEHETLITGQPWRTVMVFPSYVRYRNVSGEAVYARVRVKRYYSTGWQDTFVSGWQKYKYTSGLIGDSPKWYFFDWQTNYQWEGWASVAAGHYAAYVDYALYAGGQLVGTATMAAERSDWEVEEDIWAPVASLGSTGPGQVGYCTLPN
jgi:hypothetical protein